MRKWYEMEACNQGPIIGGQVYLVRNIMGYPDGSRVLCGTSIRRGSSEEVCVY